MGTFPQRKFTAEQWDAIYKAAIGQGISVKRTVEMAASGELTGEPFTVSLTYAQAQVAKQRAKLAGRLESRLGDLSPADSNDYMRRRLLNFFEAEAASLERQRVENRSSARLQQLAKLAREIAAMPGPKDPRPRQPGSRTPSTGQVAAEGPQGGPGGALIKALREHVRNEESPPNGGLPGTGETG